MLNRFGPVMVLGALLAAPSGSLRAQSATSAPMAPPHAPMPAPSPVLIVLAPQALAGLPRLTMSAAGEDGTAHTYSGVSLHDLIVRAGAPAGRALRGAAMASYVIATAGDGYRVLFALAEFDPGFTDNVVLVADARDGTPLSAHDGPYQLIVPFDKRPARWERNVVSIALGTPQK